jgi:hypothetical protein
MKKWEYRREILVGHHADVTTQMNTMGSTGWELIFYTPRQTEVNGYTTTESVFCVFKREVKQTDILHD